MTVQKEFLSKRQRYQAISLLDDFSDEAMTRDWTLSKEDTEEIGKYRKIFRLYLGIQICAVRLYGRFLNQVHDLSPRIVNYLGQQLGLPPSLGVKTSKREATYLEHRQNVLKYLGFQRFDEITPKHLEDWLEQKARLGILPSELFQQAECHLLEQRILLPGATVLERLIVRVCSTVHQQLFESIFQELSPKLRESIDQLLKVSEGEQRSYFHYLKGN